MSSLLPDPRQITSELYEADLEKALILSKLEYEQQKQVWAMKVLGFLQYKIQMQTAESELIEKWFPLAK